MLQLVSFVICCLQCRKLTLARRLPLCPALQLIKHTGRKRGEGSHLAASERTRQPTF